MQKHYNNYMKILSPVGNFESLKMAIYYRTNEIYFGISEFNARNNIEGFSLKDIDEIVFLSHINNVKVNLAVNILFKDDELESAVNLVVTAYNKGVDCFIIQDLGLAYILNKFYPEIEIHASTQMGIHNTMGAKEIEKMGFKRVVLARETPLEEIESIKKNTNLEIEYFAYGALCVSFSGNCFLSSYLCDASGNRGKCKQLCRLPYSLHENGKKVCEGYLLSAKDFNMINELSNLENIGVDVLKIEGRARRPFYVAVSTNEYVKALQNKKVDENALKLAFNRDYTNGYFSGNNEIISKFNNHIGVKIGEVKKVNIGKKFNEIIFSSCQKLSKKSAIKIFNDNREISTISLYDLKQIDDKTYLVTTTHTAFKGNSVNLISDFDLEEKILNVNLKTNLKIDIFAISSKEIIAKTNFLNCNFKFVGDILEKANNVALTQAEVENCFNKNEYFNVEINLETDGVFITKSSLNKFRREFFESLKIEILNSFKHNLKQFKLPNYFTSEIFSDFQIVFDKNEKLEKTNIIYSPEEYCENDILNFKEKCEKLNKNMYLDLPNFALDKDVEFLKNLVEKNNIKIVMNNYYALNFDCEKVAGGGLDVFNKVSANFLSVPIICSEDSFTQKTKFPYMTLRHCPLKNNLKVNCTNCPYAKNKYTIKTQSGKVLKLKRKKLSTCTFYLMD